MNISTGRPLKDGLYVVYVKLHAEPGNHGPHLCFWRGKAWWHYFKSHIPMSSPVLGWIGPLPEFSDPSLEYDL